MTDYDLLVKQFESLTADVGSIVSNLANTVALVYHSLDDVSWAGFYIVDGDRLLLGPFQGKTACTVIPKGKGVCGTSWAEDRTVLVKDVSDFPGHIACDSESRSEIVVPIHKNGDVWGVLDIDSYRLERFDENDLIGLEQLVESFETEMEAIM